MKKTLILASFLALAPFAKGQLLLEALEGGQNEKCLEIVKDKYYGDGDHNFIYCAVMGPGNKKWLNLNLGAEYAREGSEYFNPEAVPTNNLDWKAFGSLYNHNRDSDGHELVQYRRGTTHWEVKHKNGYYIDRPSEREKHNMVSIVPVTYDSWRSSNDPCPEGYQVVDADVLKNTAGYNIVGSLIGPSVIRHPDYINWSLVTAPVWGEAEITNSLGNDYITSLTRVTGTGYDATSSIWLRSDGNTYRPGQQFLRAFTYDMSWGEWRSNGQPGADVIGSPILDRGSGFNSSGDGRDLMIGRSRKEVVASAVRCIEK